MYVVKCENGGKPFWLASGEGDPSRTVVLNNAQIFDTVTKATGRIRRVAKDNPHRKLLGRLKVLPVELVEYQMPNKCTLCSYLQSKTEASCVRGEGTDFCIKKESE